MNFILNCDKEVIVPPCKLVKITPTNPSAPDIGKCIHFIGILDVEGNN